MFGRKPYRLTDADKHTLAFAAQERANLRRTQYDVQARYTIQGTGYMFPTTFYYLRTGAGLRASGWS